MKKEIKEKVLEEFSELEKKVKDLQTKTIFEWFDMLPQAYDEGLTDLGKLNSKTMDAIYLNAKELEKRFRDQSKQYEKKIKELEKEIERLNKMMKQQSKIDEVVIDDKNDEIKQLKKQLKDKELSEDLRVHILGVLYYAYQYSESWRNEIDKLKKHHPEFFKQLKWMKVDKQQLKQNSIPINKIKDRIEELDRELERLVGYETFEKIPHSIEIKIKKEELQNLLKNKKEVEYIEE